MTIPRRLLIVTLSIGALITASFVHAAQLDRNYSSSNTSATIYPVLNSGANAQYKAGSLLLGYPSKNPAAQLCLNPVAGSTIDNNNANCIGSWSDPRIVSGSHVRLYGDVLSLQSDFGSTPTALQASSYQRDAGYVSVKAQGQYFTTIVKAPELHACVFLPGAGSQDAGYCFGQGTACMANSDCGVVSTAVYAAGASGGNGRAGYFSGGQVLVTNVAQRNERYNNTVDYGRICLGSAIESPLNDEPGHACISSWNEITSVTTSPYVKVQTTNNPTPQSGGAMVSGTALFGGAVVGDLAGLSAAKTCGDGICTSGESSSCSVDCGGIGTPTLSAAVTLTSTIASPSIVVSAGIGTQSGTIRLIVVRSTSSTPSWQPVNGVVYTTGTINSANTIIRSSTETSGAHLQFTDTLPNQSSSQTQYYYYAYQGNDYPIYGSSQSTSVPIRVAQFTSTANYSNVVTLRSSSGTLLTCTGNTCVGLYNSGTQTVVYVQSVQTGYAVSSWTGCTTSNTTSCTLTPNGITNVSINLQSGGGGGGGGGGGSQGDV